MARKIGQIVARTERTWLVRVFLGRDRESHKRTAWKPRDFFHLQ